MPAMLADRGWRRCLQIPRAPDVVIGRAGHDYMRRWHIIPRNRWVNLYLHNFLEPDAGDLHDHPYWSVSIVLRGLYIEELPGLEFRTRPAFSVIFRKPTTAHRIVHVSRDGAWTLFITGPRVRRWGFHTEGGWTPASESE